MNCDVTRQIARCGEGLRTLTVVLQLSCRNDRFFKGSVSLPHESSGGHHRYKMP